MKNRQRIQNSIDYMEKNLKENLDIKEIAGQSHFSEFHFHRLFRESMGMSVMEYVRKRRLSEAASDLAGSEENITEIAFRYQFGNEESFSRAFKKQYGLNPRNYRRQMIDNCGTGAVSGGTALMRAA